LVSASCPPASGAIDPAHHDRIRAALQTVQDTLDDADPLGRRHRPLPARVPA